MFFPWRPLAALLAVGRGICGQQLALFLVSDCLTVSPTHSLWGWVWTTALVLCRDVDSNGNTSVLFFGSEFFDMSQHLSEILWDLQWGWVLSLQLIVVRSYINVIIVFWHSLISIILCHGKIRDQTVWKVFGFFWSFSLTSVCSIVLLISQVCVTPIHNAQGYRNPSLNRLIMAWRKSRHRQVRV